ncbi:hypothetical protein QFZ40_002131 [Arthrobacter pascens]|nr:hypothetical protein [Arthrobacter pascens]
MASQVYPDEGTGPRVMFRLLLAPSNANWGGKAHGGTVMLDEVVSTCAAGCTRPEAVAIYSDGIPNPLASKLAVSSIHLVLSGAQPGVVRGGCALGVPLPPEDVSVR